MLVAKSQQGDSPVALGDALSHPLLQFRCY